MVLLLCPLGMFRATTSIPLDARASWCWEREKERERGKEDTEGLVSIMSWNTKRMQTWNNTTLARRGLSMRDPSSLLPFSLFVPLLVSRSCWYLAYPLALIIFATGPIIPKGPRGTWDLRQYNETDGRRKSPPSLLPSTIPRFKM